LIVLWVWDVKWAYIPDWFDTFWNTSYKTYNWKRVITKLNDKNLSQISSILWWKYIKYNKIEDKLQLENTVKDIWDKIVFYREIEKKLDLTRYFVIISFLFFIIWLWLKK
jgi:hypothetical protein